MVDQGNRPTCLAVATTGGHEYLRDRLPLSVEHLFWNALQRGGAEPDGASMNEIRDGVVIDGQCEESIWPYNRISATPKPTTIAPVFRLSSGQVFSASLDTLRSALNQGLGLVVGLNLNLAFLRGNQPIDAAAAAEDLYGLHAVLAVGYDDAERLVTVKNSWGVDWADGGYGQVTYDYMDRYGIEMLVLVA